MDPVSLAAIISASILPRALPYLVRLGETMGDSFIEEAKTKFGPEAWETAKSIWSKIGDRLLKKSTGKEAVDDVLKSPDDKVTQASLENQIRKVLEEDPVLTADLEKVVNSRMEVDMNLKKVIHSVVTGFDIEGDARGVSGKITIRADEVTDGSSVTGIRKK
jgi:hypothetical protein